MSWYGSACTSAHSAPGYSAARRAITSCARCLAPRGRATGRRYPVDAASGRCDGSASGEPGAGGRYAREDAAEPAAPPLRIATRSGDHGMSEVRVLDQFAPGDVDAVRNLADSVERAGGVA